MPIGSLKRLRREVRKGAREFTRRHPITGGSNAPTDWDDVTGKPSTFPPEAHTHVSADITDLVVPSLTWTSVTLTLGTTNKDYYTQNVVDASCTLSSTVELKLAATESTDENEPEFTNLSSLIARPLSGSFDVTATFAEKHSGPIKVQYRIS